jgi:hypothetical protein
MAIRWLDEEEDNNNKTTSTTTLGNRGGSSRRSVRWLTDGPDFSSVQGGFQEDVGADQFVRDTTYNPETDFNPDWNTPSPEVVSGGLANAGRLVAAGAASGASAGARLLDNFSRAFQSGISSEELMDPEIQAQLREWGATDEEIQAAIGEAFRIENESSDLRTFANQAQDMSRILQEDSPAAIQRPENLLDSDTPLYWLEQAGRSLLQQVPNFAIGRGAGLAGIGLQAMGNSYEEVYNSALEKAQKQEGLSPEEREAQAREEANEHFLTRGVPLAVLEMLPYERISRGAGGSSLLREVGEGAAAEVTAELAGQTFQDTYDVVARGEEAKPVSEALRDLVDAAGTGAVGGGVAAGGAGAISRVPTIRTGNPIADAAAEVTADIQRNAGVNVEAPESASEPVSTPEATPVVPTPETSPESVTEASVDTQQPQVTPQRTARWDNETNQWVDVTTTDTVDPTIEDRDYVPEMTREEAEAILGPRAPQEQIDQYTQAEQERAENRRAVIQEMMDEGWSFEAGNETQGRRAEIARRMAQRGFPEEGADALPDASARTYRPAQAEAIQPGDFTRTWDSANNTWVDGFVVSREGDSLVVENSRGERTTYPDTEVERMEKSAPRSLRIRRNRALEQQRQGEGTRAMEAVGVGSEGTRALEQQQRSEGTRAMEAPSPVTTTPPAITAETTPTQPVTAAPKARRSRKPTTPAIEGEKGTPLTDRGAIVKRAYEQLRSEGREGDIVRLNEITKELSGESTGVLENANEVPDGEVKRATTTSEIFDSADQIPERFLAETPETDLTRAIGRGGSAKDVLARLKPLIKSPGVQRLSNKLESLLDLGDINIVTMDTDTLRGEGAKTSLGRYFLQKNKMGTLGAYWDAHRTVALKGRGFKNNGLNVETLLHELQHAASVHVYKAVKAGTITDARAKKAVEDIDALHQQYKEALPKALEGVTNKATIDRLKYAATNPLEFMAVASSSPLVQMTLRREGLWQRFVDAIRRLIGLGRGDMSVLERILQATEAVMEAQAATQPKGAPKSKAQADADISQLRDILGVLDFNPDTTSHIEVDGVERPTTNSNGNLIHPTEDGIRNFWKWFGNSKVVNEDGKPLVVYHGTMAPEDFSAFRTTVGSFRLGAHFGTTEQAESLVNEKMRVRARAEARNAGRLPDAYKPYSGAPRFIPVYLSIQNPKRVEDQGDEARWSEAIEQAIREGHDGLVYENTEEGEGDSYVAFYPEQIKSAIGNRGTFDPTDAGILAFNPDEASPLEGMVYEMATSTTGNSRVTDRLLKRYNKYQRAFMKSVFASGDVDQRIYRNTLESRSKDMDGVNREFAFINDELNRAYDTTKDPAIFEEFIKHMQGKDSRLSDEQKKVANKARKAIDRMLLELLGESYKTNSIGPHLQNAILNNIGTGLRRVYRVNSFRPTLGQKTRNKDYYTVRKTEAPDVVARAEDYIRKELLIPDASVIDSLSDDRINHLAQQYGIPYVKRETKIKHLLKIKEKYESDEAMIQSLIDEVFAANPTSPKLVWNKRRTRKSDNPFDTYPDVSPVIKEAWGEYTKPSIVVGSMMTELGLLTTKVKTLDWLYREGKAEGFVRDQSPGGKDWVELKKGSIIEPDKPQTINSFLGDLEGKWVPKSVAYLLQGLTNATTRVKTSEDRIFDAGNTLLTSTLWRGLNGIPKLYATALNASTSIIQMASNASLLVGDQAIDMSTGTQGWKNVGKAFRMAWIDAVGRNPSDKTRDEIVNLVRRGALRDGLSLGEIKSLVSNLEREMEVGGKFTMTFNKALDASANFYQMSDNIPKIAGYYQRVIAYRKMYPEMSFDEVQKMAGDQVMDSYVTFSRAFPWARASSRILGNFATFPAEVIRTTVNRFVEINKYVDYLKQDDLSAEQRNTAQKMIANTTLGAVLSLGMMSGLAYLLSSLGGEDDEQKKLEQQEDLSALVGERQANSVLTILNVDTDKHSVFVADLGRVSPTGPAYEIVSAGARKGAGGALRKVGETFFSPGPFLQGVIGAVSGKDPMTKQEMDGLERAGSLTSGFVPGVVKSISRVFSKEAAGFDPTAAWLAVVAPVTEIRGVDAVKSKLNQYSRKRDENNRMIGSGSLMTAYSGLETAKPLPDSTVEALANQWLAADYDNWEEARRTVRAGERLLGMDSEEFEEARSGANNFSKSRLSSLRNGEYSPQLPSDQFWDGMYSRLERENRGRGEEFLENLQDQIQNRRDLFQDYILDNWEDIIKPKKDGTR